ncbi:MAG: STAS domain-containing protein [Shewanella sp.]
MNITLDNQADQGFKVAISGDMDAIGCKEIKEVVDRIITMNFNGEIIMDLEQVNFMDSSGIGAIVYLYKRLKEVDRVISLHNVSGQPLELMQLLRIDSAIAIHSKHANAYRDCL